MSYPRPFIHEMSMQNKWLLKTQYESRKKIDVFCKIIQLTRFYICVTVDIGDCKIFCLHPQGKLLSELDCWDFYFSGKNLTGWGAADLFAKLAENNPQARYVCHPCFWPFNIVHMQK